MNKCTLALLFLLAPVLALAGVVPQGSAKANAEQFFNKVAPARETRLQLVFEAPRMTKAVTTDPAYYIFADEGGGYVIASGDDCVPTILGYSTTGTFRAEEMPDNMKAWLDMWSDIVEGCRANGAAPWQEPARTKAGSAKLLETASWGQHSPFNDKCYVLDGQHALTGCTATATAILMRYHQWPDKGVGTLPAYTFNRTDGDKSEQTQEAVPLGHPYDWDNMPLNGMTNRTVTLSLKANPNLTDRTAIVVFGGGQASSTQVEIRQTGRLQTLAFTVKGVSTFPAPTLAAPDGFSFDGYLWVGQQQQNYTPGASIALNPAASTDLRIEGHNIATVNFESVEGLTDVNFLGL